MGKQFYAEYARAETKWKLYVFYLVRKTVIHFGIEKSDMIKIIIRFFASVLNDEVLFLTKEDKKGHVKTSIIKYFDDITRDYDYYDYTLPSTRNMLVKDIIDFHFLYIKNTWEEIEADKGNLTWRRWKEKKFENQLRKKRKKEDKPKKSCSCEFCTNKVGFCLKRLVKKMEGKDGYIDTLVASLGAKSQKGESDDEDLSIDDE